MPLLHEFLAEKRADGIRRGWHQRSPAPRETWRPYSDAEIEEAYREQPWLTRVQWCEADIALADRYPDRSWSGPMRDRAIRLLSEMKEK